MTREDKVEKKADLLDNFMATTSDNTVRKDFRILKKEYQGIEPGSHMLHDPLIQDVFKSKKTILKAIVGVLGVRVEIRLSECPTLSEIKESGVPFGKMSVEKYEQVMMDHGLRDKLK